VVICINMLVFVHFYKMNTLFKYFESLPVGLNINVKSLYIAVIVAEPGAQCALSMACLLQCGQQRPVTSLVPMTLKSPWYLLHFNPISSTIKLPRMSYSCNN